ncbi:MAG: hypothetical protein J6Z30_08880 [Pyramidobacter sp.]|nr:hypothetical protein [Pyramidobacter sp.]
MFINVNKKGGFFCAVGLILNTDKLVLTKRQDQLGEALRADILSERGPDMDVGARLLKRFWYYSRIELL